MKYKFLMILIAVVLVSCKKETPIIVSSNDYSASIENVSQIMLHDIFSPPVASRIYVYPNVAAYEVMAQNNSSYMSLQNQLHGLDSIPVLDKKSGVNQKVAAVVAHIEVSKALVFSEEMVVKFRDSLYKKWRSENEKEFETSKEYGLKVAERVKKWMSKDNYKQTRTLAKFTVHTNDKSRWQPTPPAYMEAVEPHWSKIRTLVLDTASQFKPAPALPFSLDKNAPFYKNVQEVYLMGKEIAKKGDKSEEVQIAQFWDCNPYATVTQGHMMFAKKKISPGGHWMGIVKIACNESKATFEKTVYANTLVSIGLFESFISCWDEKYRSNVVRPETVINQSIDENWRPLLQTPPFPEYTSGHSVASNCSALLLTKLFGANFAYADTSEVQFGLPIRKYNSFQQAADEASISRFYGGIHYKPAIENGSTQGKNIGRFIQEKIKFTK
jgi:hypothetical protein